MKTIRLALLLSVVALVTTACFRLEVAFTVNEDGSGIVRYQIAVKEDLMELGGEELNLSEEWATCRRVRNSRSTVRMAIRAWLLPFR